MRKMEKPQFSCLFGVSFIFHMVLFFSGIVDIHADDADTMNILKKNLNPSPKGWDDPGAVCDWEKVRCNSAGRVTKIQIGNMNLGGSLPKELAQLSELEQFEVMYNSITGPFPSLAGLKSLRKLLAHNNQFSSIPSDLFTGMTSLQMVSIDGNPFSAWEIPESLRDATSLRSFSANGVNLTGTIPDFMGRDGPFPGLVKLDMGNNYLQGKLPASFSDSSIQILVLNNQNGNTKLNGNISVLQNMTSLTQVWLHENQLTGPIPELENHDSLSDLSLRDNQLTGVVPQSLMKLPKLRSVNLTNNLLQGPRPIFPPGVQVGLKIEANSFCTEEPAQACSPVVNTLLTIAKDFNYPEQLAKLWKGNDPCSGWTGVHCVNGEVEVITLSNKGLTGKISPSFADLKSLKKLILSNNKLWGRIPDALTKLPLLKVLDVEDNLLFGKIPSFRNTVIVKVGGNPDIGEDKSIVPAPPGEIEPVSEGVEHRSRKHQITAAIYTTVGVAVLLCLVGGALVLYRCKRRRRLVLNSKKGSPNISSNGIDSISDVADTGNMMISIEVLREVTHNFSEELGRGGFGIVYKGELHDGTKIAVKRMESVSASVDEKGLNEFKSEIAVLTKVRHRHLVSLLGFCLEGNERILVYEYMPLGTLSTHLFHWKREGLKHLDWTTRLTIALDVARGVEYLHAMAHQNFVHRDLKPSNILLGDNMRAKVSDFGLVRRASEVDEASIVTKIAGTFGYLAPEYAATGRVTTKVDVYSFGIILMELITGRKALDDSLPEESYQLVLWFRTMQANKDTFREAIDPVIEVKDDTLASINTVAELAGHCSVRDPQQRPDMSHVVNVLSSLVDLWKPVEPGSEDIYAIDLDMTLTQALQKWQVYDGMSTTSSYLLNQDTSSQTGLLVRPR